MSDPLANASTQARAGQAIEVTIRLGLVLILLAWGFRIVSPFVHAISWGAILAVALHPVFDRACASTGGRRKLVGGLFILGSFALVIVPTTLLISSSIDGARELAGYWEAGKFRIPPPGDKVQQWPVIGERLYETWLEASTNLQATIRRFSPQLMTVGEKLLGFVTGSGATLVGAAFSLVIAGVLMIHAEVCSRFASALGRRLVGDEGPEFVDLATATVRSVAMGVVGTAVIQAAAAALGMAVLGIPLVAVWALLLLVVAVAQLPPLLVLAPIAAWAFSAYPVGPATAFAIWCLLVGVSDNFLKPLLLGRGVNIPMLVILIGAIGGMLSSGIMGLFVGAVVLALIYRLFLAWLQDESPAELGDGTQLPT